MILLCRLSGIIRPQDVLAQLAVGIPKDAEHGKITGCFKERHQALVYTLFKYFNDRVNAGIGLIEETLDDFAENSYEVNALLVDFLTIGAILEEKRNLLSIRLEHIASNLRLIQLPENPLLLHEPSQYFVSCQLVCGQLQGSHLDEPSP